MLSYQDWRRSCLPPTPLDSRFRGNDEWEGIPTDAGMTRFENWVHWMMGGSGVVCATHATPGWGQAPALHFSWDPRLSLFG